MLITYSFLHKFEPNQNHEEDSSFYLSITILHGFQTVQGRTKPKNNTKTKKLIKTTTIECTKNVSKYFLFSKFIWFNYTMVFIPILQLETFLTTPKTNHITFYIIFVLLATFSMLHFTTFHATFTFLTKWLHSLYNLTKIQYK